MNTFSVMALNEFLQIQNNTDIIFTSKKDSDNSQEKNQVQSVYLQCRVSP